MRQLSASITHGVTLAGGFALGMFVYSFSGANTRSLPSAQESMPRSFAAIKYEPVLTVTTHPLPLIEHRLPPLLPMLAPELTPEYRPVIEEVASFDPLALARLRLIATAHPGGTMTMLGRHKALDCFPPQFAMNLAAAIDDARAQGMESVGVFSGFRPPALGVGGFGDKFKSLHSYCLAVDMHGIGRPGSRQAKLWHHIAAKHNVACVYGPNNHAEWNHCQGTKLKVAPPALRRTITAKGPKDLDTMWKAASSILVGIAKPVTTLLAMNETREKTGVGKTKIKNTKFAKRHRHKHVRYAKHHRRHHVRVAKRHRHHRRQDWARS